MNGNEQTFRQLFDLSADAIMLLDEHTFLYCNAATLQIFDCPSSKVFCSKHPSDISPLYQPCGESSRVLADQHISDAMRLGFKRFEWLHKRLSGETFYAEVLLSPATWNGAPVLQAVVRDISEYKQLQHALEEAKDRAEKAAIAKSEFLAVMSHEIRTPIHGIIGAQELLLASPLSDDQRENGLLVLHSAKALLGTIDDVLDFSKIDAGKLGLEEVAFAPHLLLKDVYELLKAKAAQKGIALSLSNPPLERYLRGDSGRIRQIVLNLLGNAIKFTDAGAVQLSSQFSRIDRDTYRWQVDIMDTGIGMDETQQAHVFDMFAQADSSTTRKYGGTGLGLAISHALAELMGGSISLVSEKNRGSCFSLALELYVSEQPPDLMQEEAGVSSRNYRQRVLVAEDNLVNQKIIVKQLERLGLNIDLVGDGQQACERYRELREGNEAEPYQLILMDLQMPTMNGIEATRQLRESGCKVPIVALTADVLKERKDECLAAGMNEFITKPFEQRALVALLDRYLGRC